MVVNRNNIEKIADDFSEKVKFSVLMSVYNKETPEHLKIAIDSVIGQSVPPTEIVLVKDGQLNDSLNKVISCFQNDFSLLRVVDLKENVGLGRSLNEGMRHCRYNIVARMDTDDCSLPDRFEKQLSVLLENPQLDVVGSNVREYDEDLDVFISIRNVPEHDFEIKKFLRKRNPINHMSVMYRKDKVLAAGGYVDCPYFEDYYLWCRMSKEGCEFYNIQEPLVNVRAGIDMFERRGGMSYARNAINFEKKIFKLHLINILELFYNSFARVTIALFPSKLRQIFYLKKLRGSER